MSSVEKPSQRSSDNRSIPAEELHRLVGELAALLEAEASPEVFHAALLEKVMQATGGAAAAIWQRDARGRLVAVRENNLRILNIEQVPNGTACHALLLEDGFAHGRTFWVSPHEGQTPEGNSVKVNFSACALLIAPIVVEKRTLGLLEVLFQPEPERPVKRQLARLTVELAAIASAYLHRTHWQETERQHRLSRELEDFSDRVHGSLDPEEIAYHAANDGKKLLGCDQVGIVLCWGNTCRVAAVSGAVSVARRSPLIQAMRRLAQAIRSWGEGVCYEGTRDVSLPPHVNAALDEYLAQSNGLRLTAVPLVHRGVICAVLFAESFRNQDSAQVPAKVKALERHLAPALANALKHRRLPLRWLSAPLACCRDALLERGYPRVLFFLTGVLLLAALLVFVQLPLRSEASGRLVPRERRIVYAHVAGKVVHMAAQHGDRVDRGQELLFIEDMETQLKADQLLVAINSLAQKVGYLDEQLNKNISVKERSDLLGERLKAQFELNKSRMERNLLVSEYRNPRKAPVTAPVTGQVLTFDAQEKLLGKTVKRGDPLVRLANVTGHWEIDLLIPEREIGTVREALARSPRHELLVDLLVSSDPQRIYEGRLVRDSLGGETTIQDNKVVLPATVDIADQALLALIEGMPVGVEVHARVRCGHAAAGYVWFNELWQFLYERLVF